ncbi:GAF domain-containing protein [Cytophagaceae bacterium DM2B3-1]|uniref:GAF domain-containing protein n=1 Tax=Xanthocytophaga flava TaxID=3048013 RepID=A0ABT7CNM1_9BACT|nr:GAF domain-containing protein [Xanthocytophaga flavus]MDJ1495282.1 GAF domain-containing protein [Xanthocytophaga flavus]
MSIFNNLKIKHKILFIIGLNMFFFVLSGSFCYRALILLDNSQQQLITNTSAIYNQMNADMMHDALRADVYKALLLEDKGEVAQKAFRTEFNEHKASFQKSLEVLSELDINDSVKIAVHEVLPALNKYIVQSEQLIAFTFQKDSVQIAAGLIAFNASFDLLAEKMSVLSALISDSSEKQNASANGIVSFNKLLIVGILIASLCVIGGIGFRTAKLLSEPILKAKDVLSELSLGNLMQITDSQYTDEIGEMNQALHTLVDNLSNIKGFATEVGNGKFDSNVSVFNNSGELGTALATMRQSLKTISEEENKRNWGNTGITQVNEILRSRNENFSILLDQVISFIIKYTQTNQGCISLVDSTNPQDLHLSIQACYAYNRKKYINKRIEIGEGLAGQVVLEKETIYLQEIPHDYIAITSGLGEATPKNILIVPMKVDEEVVGVLEVASLQIIPAHHIQFLERVCTNLGLHVSNENKNIQTRNLLEMTLQQKEALQSQEEEVRQNMEELYAIQEDVRRRESEYLQRIEELEQERTNHYQVQVRQVQGAFKEVL